MIASSPWTGSRGSKVRGLDGVIAKPLALTYEPGKRAMLKIKHVRTADCVVGGFRWHKSGRDRVGSLLLGLYDRKGTLHHVGITSAFTMATRKALVDELAPLRVERARRASLAPLGRRRRLTDARRPEPLERRQRSFVGAAAHRARGGSRGTTTCRAIDFATRRSFCAGGPTSSRRTAATISSKSPRLTNSHGCSGRGRQIFLTRVLFRCQRTVRHLATHSSEGIPGNEYVYGSSRYARLGEILKQALKATTFEEVLRKEILTPARMTWRDSPHLGAHAGFLSTVSDMAMFVQALQENRLLSRERFEEMTTPFVSMKGLPIPVGVGFFSQQLGDERVVWSFGQDDPDHSSALLLMLPKRNLALVLLANTDELSNPFRLLMGDLRYSPFATAFLDAFAPEVGKSIGKRERLAQDTLLSLWNQDRAAARQRFHQFARLPPGGPHDFVAHFIAASLVDGETREYAQVLDTDVYVAHPTNRWVLLMSGGLNSRLERFDVAGRRYEAILALRNQEPDGLASLFRAWSYTGLANIYRSTDPKRALQYVEHGLATGVTGGTRNDLIGLQKELASP